MTLTQSMWGNTSCSPTHAKWDESVAEFACLEMCSRLWLLIIIAEHLLNDKRASIVCAAHENTGNVCRAALVCRAHALCFPLSAHRDQHQLNIAAQTRYLLPDAHSIAHCVGGPRTRSRKLFNSFVPCISALSPMDGCANAKHVKAQLPLFIVTGWLGSRLFYI